MKRPLTLAVLLLVLAPAAALAQSDDYRKIEFFGGYSTLLFDNLGGDTDVPEIDELLGGRDNLRGFNVALNYNFHKYVGVKADYSLQAAEDVLDRSVNRATA